MSRSRNPIRNFASDSNGAAAAEMALVMPLLLIIMFGAMELGKFFLDQHVVVKSVRDDPDSKSHAHRAGGGRRHGTPCLLDEFGVGERHRHVRHVRRL